MINIYLVTPLLGFLKNYSKYKEINFYVFIRTPIIYFLIHNVLLYYNYDNIELLTIIYERWFFFIYKTFLSIYHNDYQKKKRKI